MKRTILTFIAALLIGLSAQTQELNTTAKYYKQHSIERYNEFKTFAEQEWKGDHEMMVYVINNQANAFNTMVVYSGKADWDEYIYIEAVETWTTTKNKHNIVDWEMVVYVYEKQLKSKGAY